MYYSFKLITVYLVISVGRCLSEHVGTKGCSDNQNVRIIEVLAYSIDAYISYNAIY